MNRNAGVGKQDITGGNLTYGYVTQDVRFHLVLCRARVLITEQSCPDAGDDTMHVALPVYYPPWYIGSKAPNVTDDTPVDLVFLEFLEKGMLRILNSLQKEKNYTKADVSSYSPTLTDAVLGLYAQAMWN